MEQICGRWLKVDFVGSLSNGPASLGDKDHEGHRGFRIDRVPSVDGWLDTQQPDITLLMIGTNDMFWDNGLKYRAWSAQRTD